MNAPENTQSDTIRIGSEMDRSEGAQSLARDWAEWTHQMGHRAHPILSELADTMPELGAAVVCTTDGLNICALGVAARQAGRFSALSSSLVSLATAHQKLFHFEATPSSGTLSISDDDRHTVLAALSVPGEGSFILATHAEAVQLGVLMVATRRTVERLIVGLAGDNA